MTETYYIHHHASVKLRREADRSELKLRYLVAHANMLDTITEHIHETEREHEGHRHSRGR